MNEQNIIKISVTSQYTIYTDRVNFITFFTPSDLVRKTENSFCIISGLENVFEKRKQVFLNNLKQISEWRNISLSANVLPDYTEINETNNIIYAKSRYYYTDKMNMNDSDEDFFYKILLICRFMKNTVSEKGIEPVIELDNVIFEKNITHQMHILYIDLMSKEKSPLCMQIKDMIIGRLFGRKQRFPDNISKKKLYLSNQYPPKIQILIPVLLNSLTPCCHKPSDWNISCDMAEKICEMMNEKGDYLLYPYIPTHKQIFAISQNIRNAFENFGHIVFLRSENKKLLCQLTDSYINETDGKYMYITRGSAENGLQNMLESDTFTFNSGKKSASECISSLKNMCRDGCLIIIENCDIENDAFFKHLLRLPADIMILTKQDYSEYGFFTLEF